MLLPDASSTMFSKGLLAALIGGSAHREDRLSLRDVKELAMDSLYEIRDAPRPVVLSPDQSEGDVADIPFFPNPWIEKERLRRDEEERVRQAEAVQAHLAEEEKERVRQAEEDRRRQAEEEEALIKEERTRKAQEEQARLAEVERMKKAEEEQARLLEEEKEKKKRNGLAKLRRSG